MSENENKEQLPSLEKAGEVLAKRVQGAFVDLITEEQMKGLVKKAITKYTTPVQNGYRAGIPKSPLEQDIEKEVEKVIQPQVQEGVKNALNEVSWSEDKLKEFVAQVAPQAMERVFQNLITTTIQNMQNNVY